MIEKDFWKYKTLEEMFSEEWEALCCKCGVCCLYKMRDMVNNKLKWTNIACHYLDLKTLECQVYNKRKEMMPSCIELTPENVKDFEYLPEECIYRIVANEGALPDWHPLITGNPKSILQNPNKLNFDTIVKKHI